VREKKNMISKIKELRFFNFKLFISLCIMSLFPAIYQTTRTFILSNHISTDAFDVLGQMEWFDLIHETLLAFLIIPLYSIFNKILREDKENFKYVVFKFSIVVLIVYTIFQCIVYLFTLRLIQFMNQNNVDVHLVYVYLRLEVIAFILGIIPNIVKVVFVVTKKSRNVYIFLIVQVVLTIIADFIMIPYFGIRGVAFSNMLINLCLTMIGVLILILEKNIKPSKFKKENIKLFKKYVQTGIFSGAQQFIDNMVYAIMICKMVNMVSEQGNYWIANNFIWGWLLIPIYALTEVIRSDCKEGYHSIKQGNYYFIILFIIILWGITMPLWPYFYKNVEMLENYKIIFNITAKLFPFYIAYAFCIIPDNIFIGLGKTKYNTINSVIINFIYYGTFYVLYKIEAINFTINTIIFMFGFGMVIHLFISWIEQYIFCKYELSKISD
jgi:hypothetical protein